MTWLRRGLGLAGALVLLAVVGIALHGCAALPQTDGTLTLPGLHDEVHIERDADGIPTIRATNVDDLMFGLGVVHAQDRLWQMETHRRIGAGRLAEAFGDKALPNDRFLRALGVRRAAAVQWARTQGEGRAGLRAYARGVNAVLHHALGARPPEYVLMGLQPEDWDPVDSLAWGLMMAWDLSGNWTNELLRLRLSQHLPVERINQLLPPYPGESPLQTADYAALYRSLDLPGDLGQQALLAAPLSGIEGVGSNNWVVSGSRTASGKPLLANDPHLKLTTPALWYFVRLEAPGLHVAGATMPGLPAVVLGQNDHIAWGFTNTGPDVQDLYLERVKPDDPTRYQTPEGWAAFDAVADTIKVKGAPDVKVSLRHTRHGPVISDAGVGEDRLGKAPGRRYVLAMRWTALDADASLIDAAVAMMRAQSVDQFVAATRGWAVPMQNMVVADTAGHIGFVAAGRVPLRKPDNDLKGQVPAPGWDARYDWDGWVPADATPREVDPPSGWIATANQKVTPEGYPYYLTNEWAMPVRAERIGQLLQATPKHTSESFAAMQADVKSLYAARVLPWLLKAQSNHPLAKAAHDELARFDGTMAADRAAPLIFWSWARHLVTRVFADELGETYFQRVLGGRSFLDGLEGVLQRDDAWWCDNKHTKEAETCQQQIDGAFTDALDELQARFGPDVSRWHWGDAHIARAEHRPLTHVPFLARWFELREPVGGDTFTLDVGRVGMQPDPVTGELYLDEHAPSLRAIYDLGDPKNSRIMHSSGQSGIVFSPLYRNFAERWAKVEYVPLWPQTAPVHTLTVRPSAASASAAAP